MLAVGPTMMARGTTSSTILRVEFAGIPYQNLKHQPHVMAGVFTDSLSSEFFYSSIRDLGSCRHRQVRFPMSLSACLLVRRPHIHHQPTSSTPTISHSRPGYLHLSNSTVPWCHLSTIQSERSDIRSRCQLHPC